MMRYFIVGAVAVVGYVGLDYLEPRIQKMLNLSPENQMGVKAVKYGTLGGISAITFWVVDKYVK